MVYRETEMTRAQRQGQANNIVLSAAALVREGGLAAMTSRAVAERAGVAKGLIFRYFPGMDELVVQVEAAIMQRDLEAMRISCEDCEPVKALVMAIKALFSRMQRRESREMASMLHYPRGISTEIERLLNAIVPDDDHKLVARATLGIVCQLGAMGGPAEKRERTAVLFVLKGIGASAAVQRKARELV